MQVNEEEIYQVLERTNEYLSQRFSREEKINMMIWEILRKLKEDFSRTITICSLDFHYNFEPEVQEGVLKYLQDTEKCVKFKILDEEVLVSLVNCECVEMPTFAEDDFAPHWDLESKAVIEKAARARYFKIEALQNFEQVAQKICGAGGTKYTLKYDIADKRLYINGAYITQFKANSQNLTVFEHLYSGDYKFGYTVKLREIVGSTSRKMAQFKYNVGFGKAIFDAFFSVDGQSFSFRPEIDVTSLTPENKEAIDKEIEHILNANRYKQLPF